jgi:nicotinic acid mononucleotide adenylyltransferase
MINMNLFKCLTLSTALMTSAQAIILEDIIAGKHAGTPNRSVAGQESCSFSSSQEESDSIPAFKVAMEPLLTDEEGGGSTMEEDGYLNTGEEEDATSMELDLSTIADKEEEAADKKDGAWPSQAFEEGWINQHVLKFFENATVAYYIGSFDPIHNGHRGIAEQVVKLKICDYTLMCPIWGGDTLKERTSIEKRLDMVFSTFRDHPEVIVTRLPPQNIQELFAKLQSLNSKNIVVKIPGLKFKGVIGSDIPLTFVEKMQEYVPHFMAGTVISPKRCNTTYGAVDALPVESYVISLRHDAPKEVKEMRFFAGKTISHFIKVPHFNSISSTEIKSMLKTGKSIRDSVPPAVACMIYEENLYEMKDLMASSPTDIEDMEEGHVEVINLPSINIVEPTEEEDSNYSTIPSFITFTPINRGSSGSSDENKFSPFIKDNDTGDDCIQNEESNNNNSDFYNSYMDGILSPRYGDPLSASLKHPSIGKLNLSPRGNGNPEPTPTSNPKDRDIAGKENIRPSNHISFKEWLNKLTTGPSSKKEPAVEKPELNTDSIYCNAKPRPIWKSQSSDSTREKLVTTINPLYDPARLTSQSSGSTREGTVTPKPRLLSKSHSSGATRDKLKISPPSISAFSSLALSPRSPCSSTSNQCQTVNIINRITQAS